MQPVFQIRIQLAGLKPAIYRDVLVAPDITLRKLHKVIQAAMGWEDCHLYSFSLPKKRNAYFPGQPVRRFEPPTDDFFGESSANNDAKFKLIDVMDKPKAKLLYLYDFGDYWEHTITLTQIGETESPLPHLAKAANGCPPEDCGGVPGAAHWAAIWYDKKHPEHEVALAIFGEQEPNWLDFPRLQKAVAKLQPKASKKTTQLIVTKKAPLPIPADDPLAKWIGIIKEGAGTDELMRMTRGDN